MYNKKVEITGLNTNNIKILKNSEMQDLFLRYYDGDQEAKRLLIEGNLRLVLSILQRINISRDDVEDLFQIGVIGLTKAVENFDLSIGVKFSTYAVPLIFGEMKRYNRDSTPIRVSRSIKDKAYKILEFKEDFFNKHGYEAPDKLIAESLGLEEYEIPFALNSLKDPVSIFKPIYNDGGDTLYLLDQIADNTTDLNKRDLLISLRNAIGLIKQKEREVIIARYIMGMTQIEIAENLGISQAQISRIEKNGLENIKKMVR